MSKPTGSSVLSNICTLSFATLAAGAVFYFYKKSSKLEKDVENFRKLLLESPAEMTTPLKEDEPMNDHLLSQPRNNLEDLEKPNLFQKITHRKYMDSKRWVSVSRPQYKYSCGISSLTSIFNFLYSNLGYGAMHPLTQESVLQVLGFQEPFEEISFGTFSGNQTIMKWFDVLCKRCNVDGQSSYFFKLHGIGKTSISSNEALELLKKGLKSKKIAFLYHLNNHYMTLLGFEEAYLSPKDAYLEAPQFLQSEKKPVTNWILFGDTSKTSSSLHCVKWSDIKLDISLQSPNYVNIRHLEQGIQKRRRSKHSGSNLHCLMIFASDRNDPLVQEIFSKLGGTKSESTSSSSDGDVSSVRK